MGKFTQGLTGFGLAVFTLMGLSAVGLSAPASAGSFAINENAASDLGRANSGRVVSVQDASAAFGNPALLPQFDALTVTSVMSYIDGHARFADGGSTDAFGGALGGNTDGFFDNAIIPALHAVWPLGEDLSLGLSVNAPYGLASSYDPNWVGRYQAVESALTTINVNPSIGYRLNDTLSIGAGISAQYAHATLSSAVDFGTICVSQLGPDSCGDLGLGPQNADGTLALEDGTDISFGYNFGVALTPSDAVTLGAHFRSEVKHRLKGEAKVDVPTIAQPLTAGGAFVDTDWAAELPLPAQWELGLRWQASDRLTLYADYTQTDWSTLGALDAEFENPAQPPSEEVLNYEDAGRYAVGLDAKLSDHWTLRLGYAADESPAQSAFRSARIPDNDRNIYAVGLGFKTGHWTVDAAYNRLDVDTTAFVRVGPVGDRVTGTLNASADIFALSLTRAFE